MKITREETAHLSYGDLQQAVAEYLRRRRFKAHKPAEFKVAKPSHHVEADVKGHSYELDRDPPCVQAFAVGEDPISAIRALWPDAETFEELPPNDDDKDAEDPEFNWGFRFASEGVSFKAAGKDFPGGTILTWWK